MSAARLAMAAVLLLLGLGGGFLVASSQRPDHEARARQASKEELDLAWTTIAKRLEGAATDEANRAQALANDHRFGAVVQKLSDDDRITGLVDGSENVEALRATLTDLKRNEPWFSGHVADAAVAVYKGPGTVFWSSSPVAFQLAGPLGALGKSSGEIVVDADEHVFAVGMARVPSEKPSENAIFVVLWKPVELGALSKGWSFLVTRDGTSQGAGLEAGVAALRAASTTEPPCCSTRDLSKGVTLGVFVDPSPRRDEANAGVRRGMLTFVPLGGVLGGLAALLVFFLGRRSSQAEAERDALLRESQLQLRQSQEALQRLSTGAFATQAAAAVVAKTELDLALASTQASVAASRYEVVAPLGEGGMARVYVAIVRGAEGFKRTFVLKRLKPEHVGNQELVNQFIDEARLGASLVHSNIVPILDFGRDADGYFLTQEYILGRNIDALIEASMETLGRPLDPAVVATIGQEALKALGYAHTRTDDSGKFAGLVHRDVSPANLMISRRGEVKLLDFGIVKSADRVTQTQAGMVKGNLFYMSPEQARALPVDPRSDLFSLGMVMATAVLGRPLYSGNSMLELMNRAAAGPTNDDLDLVAKGAGPLVPFLQKALSVDPDHRCSSAVEMAAELAVVVQAAPSSRLEALVNELFGPTLDAERQRFSGAA